MTPSPSTPIVQLFTFLAAAASALLVLSVHERWRRRSAAGATRVDVGSADEAVPSSPEEDASPRPDATPLELAEQLGELMDSVARAQDLLYDARFDTAVGTLAEGQRSSLDLLSYATGMHTLAACLALEALARRDDDADLSGELIARIDVHGGWRTYYALRALHGRARAPVVMRLVVTLHEGWAESIGREWLAEFLSLRLRAGEQPRLADVAAEIETYDAERRLELDRLIDVLSGMLPPALVEEYEQWKRSRTNLPLLRSIGRLRGRDGDRLPHVVEHAALTAAVDALEERVRRTPTRPVVLTGEQGAGKSSALAVLAQRLLADGWIIFEASAADLIAGQIYIGQLDGRIRSLVAEIEQRNVLWVIPEFTALLHSGRTQQDPTGTLDRLIPFFERGTLRVVGEARSDALARLLQQRQRLKGVIDLVHVAPLSPAEAAAVLQRWAEPRGIETRVLEDAQQLAAQHLAEQGSPGAAFKLLRQAVERAAANVAEPDRALDRDDVVAALTALTGIPRDVVDDRAVLDVQALRRFFSTRVLGQEEAVDALVERVALLKAGLTDPTRPQGVLLFAGPTGTGKTELAKALAAYLFGSADRMIRLDMSEFQEPASLPRLLGDRGDIEVGVSIIDEIRRQPFSVVLLDELEKAHPRVWDLFLQLFDDGRLTDMNGQTASFRSAIIIMTSNIGGSGVGGGIGFGPGGASSPAGALTTASLQRLLAETFRPEFVNRIDRIVPFRPLPRTIMRELLDKEIREVLGRRGLRDRGWALEWEEPAIELLIRHGFSPTLGARPLKRAVERYLLAPLALSIVGREVPEGDQFLLIGADGDRLSVEFVDPDAPLGDDALEPPHADTPPQDAATALEDIVREPSGEPAEVDALAVEFEHLRDIVSADAWRERKAAALADTADPEFWASPRRFEVLGLAEYMDRVEVGLDTAGSLLRRLRGGRGDAGRVPCELVRRLAQQLYLVGEAIDGIGDGLPRDAFLHVTAVHEPGGDAELANAFAARLAGMYRRWADKRRMRTLLLDETNGTGTPYALLLAVSGFAAYGILAPEAGQHVLEAPGETRGFQRARAIVRVAPQPDEPPAGSITLLAQARRALGSDGADADRAAVVRRYREEPSPLVRDAVRGWRSGRLDQVLDGDFDLMG